MSTRVFAAFLLVAVLLGAWYVFLDQITAAVHNLKGALKDMGGLHRRASAVGPEEPKASEPMPAPASQPPS